MTKESLPAWLMRRNKRRNKKTDKDKRTEERIRRKMEKADNELIRNVQRMLKESDDKENG